jgi:membrane protease YdiL (CAAX protease family)
LAENGSKTLRVIELILVLGVAFASSLFGALHIYLKGFPVDAIADAPWRLANGVIHQSLSLGVLFYVLFRQGRNIRDLGLSFSWRDIPISLALLGVSYLALYFTYLVFYYVYFFSVGHTPKFWDDVAQLMGSRVSAAAIVFTLLNPWFEELIVRAYVMDELHRLTGNLWIAGIVSVVLQSLYHLYQGIPNMILLTVNFSVFAFYYAKRRRILPVVLAHFYLDFIAFAHFFFHR